MKMQISKFLLFTIVIFVNASSNVFTQDSTIKEKEWEISACPVKLLVGAAEFKALFNFTVRTDQGGLVSETKRIGKSPLDKFVDIQEFSKCIQTWRLDANERYFVHLAVATMFAEKSNYILISGNGVSIKIRR